MNDFVPSQSASHMIQLHASRPRAILSAPSPPSAWRRIVRTSLVPPIAPPPSTVAEVTDRPYHVAERATVAILALVCATFTAAAALGRPTSSAAGIHWALLVAYLGAVAVLRRLGRQPLAHRLRAVATMAVMFTLYTTLATAPFDVWPSVDPALAAIDRVLGGGISPPLRAQGLATPMATEVLAAAYAWFIPYLYLSIVLGLIGRPPHERGPFVAGFALVYAVAFVGYLFLPARGPIVALANDFTAPLPGGSFVGLVERSVAAFGGPHGAMPSLHVAMSSYLCGFDLRHNRLRGLTYAPIVVLIAVATLVLRYHFLIDLLVGWAIALGVLAALPRLLAPVARAQETEARPKLHAGSVYRVLRGYFRMALGLFYETIEVDGLEHVPSAGPTLVVANHTNGLLDPMFIADALDRPVWLTAKSTLTRQSLVRLLMAAAEVIVIHRPQDVPEGAVQQDNSDALDQIAQRLADGGAVIVFPEGQSHSDPSMRPFHRGAAHVALDYLRAGDPGGLRILPAGLYFEAKQRFRSRVRLRFGPPLDVAQWLRDNPEANARRLTEAMRERIEAVTLNFADQREADLLHWAAQLAEGGGAPPAPLDQPGPLLGARARLLERMIPAYRALDAAHDRDLGAIEARVAVLRTRLDALGLTPDEVLLPLDWPRAAFFVLRELELIVLGGPVALFGLVVHAVPAGLTRLVAGRITEDDDQFASNIVFIAIVVFLPLYAVMLVAAWLALPWSWALVLTLAVPHSGVYAVRWFGRVGAAMRRMRAFLWLSRHPGAQAELATEARAIVDALGALEAQVETAAKGNP